MCLSRSGSDILMIRLNGATKKLQLCSYKIHIRRKVVCCRLQPYNSKFLSYMTCSYQIKQAGPHQCQDPKNGLKLLRSRQWESASNTGHTLVALGVYSTVDTAGDILSHPRVILSHPRVILESS